MADDYVNTLFVVRKAISQETPLVDAWAGVVDHITDEVGTDVSLVLRGLNVARDFERLEAWLLELLQLAPLPRKIRGLRFGLFHPALGDRPSCDIDLTGSSSFEKESDAWAYEVSYQAPTHSHSPILDRLYLISAEDRFEEQSAVVHLCQWYAMLAVAELCRRYSAELRGTAVTRGIGVGFNGGDLNILGVLSKSGFKPLPLEEPKRRSKRRKLLPGEYFKLEGGREVILCDCTDKSLPRTLFESCGPIPSVSLSATINPNWPNQTGTFGSLAPFNVEFVTANVARRIEATFPDEVQLHELRIKESSEDWCVLQVLNCVKGFNREVSDQRQHLTLWGEVVAGHNFFFIEGYYTGSAVLVSRAAAQFMIDQGVIGVNFIPVGIS